MFHPPSSQAVSACHVHECSQAVKFAQVGKLLSPSGKVKANRSGFGYEALAKEQIADGEAVAQASCLHVFDGAGNPPSGGQARTPALHSFASASLPSVSDDSSGADFASAAFLGPLIETFTTFPESLAQCFLW